MSGKCSYYETVELSSYSILDKSQVTTYLHHTDILQCRERNADQPVDPLHVVVDALIVNFKHLKNYIVYVLPQST